MRSEEPLQEIERVLLTTDLVKVGMLRCPSDHPRFRTPGPTQNFALVFSRSPVLLQRTNGQKHLADSTVVNFWNAGEVYCREALTAEGAISEWFALSHDLVRDAVRALDPAMDDMPERPLRFTHAPTEPRLFLFQRQLFRGLLLGEIDGSLLAEESIVNMLYRSLARAYRFWQGGGTANEPIRHSLQKEIVERAQGMISSRFRESLSIRRIAAESGSSAFHLCRLFKRHKNTTLHAYQLQLRLRAALDLVLDTRDELTAISLDLGFSSHSHFTWAFGREFGVTPSQMRAQRPAFVKPR